MTDAEIQAIWDEACKDSPQNPGWNRHIRFARALLSKLRSPVADERAADTLTQVYDLFGIGVLARNPSTLMACLGNVIRRANCLSQVEQVLSVPTPPEPEDDGVWGEESLLRWGADEKSYTDHFKAALAEWTRRAALASTPVAVRLPPRESENCGSSSAIAYAMAYNKALDDVAALNASAPVAVEATAGYMVGTDYFRPDVLAAARIYAKNRGLTVRPLLYGDAAPQASEADKPTSD